MIEIPHLGEPDTRGECDDGGCYCHSAQREFLGEYLPEYSRLIAEGADLHNAARVVIRLVRLLGAERLDAVEMAALTEAVGLLDEACEAVTYGHRPIPRDDHSLVEVAASLDRLAGSR